MRIVFFLISIATTIQLSAMVDSIPEYQQKWDKFQSYDGRFELLTPGNMTEKVDTIQTAIGPLAYHTFYYQPADELADNVLYMLSYCDYPDHSIHSDSLELMEDFFANTIEAAVEAVDGELVYQSEVVLGRYSGRLWRIHYLEDKAMIKTKAFMVRNRYYTVQTVTQKEKSLNLSTDRFLESFRLLE